MIQMCRCILHVSVLRMLSAAKAKRSDDKNNDVGVVFRLVIDQEVQERSRIK